eukprot:RCo004273
MKLTVSRSFLPSFSAFVLAPCWLPPLSRSVRAIQLLVVEGVWVAFGTFCAENFFSPALWGAPLYPEERTPGVVWKRDWVYLAALMLSPLLALSPDVDSVCFLFALRLERATCLPRGYLHRSQNDKCPPPGRSLW